MANQRPFYVIAHRCNNSGDIKKTLERGANAVECDVHWGEGNRWCVNHNGFLPLSSMMLDKWLEEAYSDDTKEKLCFIYLDVKSTEKLSDLVNYVHESTTSLIEKTNRRIPIIYSIDNLKTAEKQFLDNAPKLEEWEGFTTDYDNDPYDVNAQFLYIQWKTGLGSSQFSRFIFSDGISAGCADREKMHKKFIEACNFRDEEKHFKKTCIWTLEKEDTAKIYLEIGVDAIMTNAGGGDVSRDKISNILDAIKSYNEEHPSMQVRMATPNDNLFEVFYF